MVCQVEFWTTALHIQLLSVSGKEARKQLSPIVTPIGAVEFHVIREDTVEIDQSKDDGDDAESDAATEIYQSGMSILCDLCD